MAAGTIAIAAAIASGPMTLAAARAMLVSRVSAKSDRKLNCTGLDRFSLMVPTILPDHPQSALASRTLWESCPKIAPPGRAGLCVPLDYLDNPALPGGANGLEQPREKKPLPLSCHSSYSPRPVDLEYM